MHGVDPLSSFQGTTQIWAGSGLGEERWGPVCTVRACLLLTVTPGNFKVLGSLRFGMSRLGLARKKGRVRCAATCTRHLLVFLVTQVRGGRRLPSWGEQERGRGMHENKASANSLRSYLTVDGSSGD